MPRGKELLIPHADLRWAAERHAEGWSLRFIARARWQQWGYASPDSANESLRRSLHYVGATARDRIEATRLAHLTHGNTCQPLLDPDHPEHQRYLDHRRHMRQQRKDRAT